MIENSLNFLKNNSDIIYIHYPFPHPPLKKNIINFDEKNETLSDYEKNLFLVDYTFLLINKLNMGLIIVFNIIAKTFLLNRKPKPVMERIALSSFFTNNFEII